MPTRNPSRPSLSVSLGISSSTGTTSGGSEMIRCCPSTVWQSFSTACMLSLVRELALPRQELRVELPPNLVDVQLRVPDVRVRHAGEFPHRVPVPTDGGHDHLTPLLAGKAIGAARDFQAGRQPLDVPFPWTRQRFVKVVDVEHEATFGRAEEAEIG